MTAENRQQAEMANGAADKAGPRKMLNEKQVLQIIPVSAVTLWRMEKKGQFPKGSYISANRKIWYEDEIIAWQNEINGRGRGRANHPSGSKS
jgi:prophage regulatory protein